MAVQIREIDDGWKVSMRSKDRSVDVNTVASLFGGGGHKAAAGYKTTGELPVIIQALLAQFGAILNK